MKIIIEKLEIVAFGCLKNKTFTPNPGENLICAPNEWGKSTYAAFIKFIFYGFGSSKKDIIDSDKKLYLPWDSPFAAGAAEIDADGVKYRIERKYAPSQKEVLSIIEIISGKKVFSGMEPGEVFFGVNMETAEKTFIFDQYCALTARDGELFDQIRNIVFDGDENGKSETALKRLKDAKKELKNTRGGGIIDTLEKEFGKYKAAYDESMGKLSAIKDINAQITQTEKSIERNEVTEKKLLSEKENSDKYDAYIKLCEFEELEKEAKNAENAYKIAVSSLEGAGIPDSDLLEELVKVNSEKITATSLSEELHANLKKTEDEILSLQKKLPEKDDDGETVKKNLASFSKSTRIFFGIGAVFAIIGICLAFLGLSGGSYYGYGAAAGLLAGAIMSVLAIMKSSKKSNYIKSFGVSSEPELISALNTKEETLSLISTKKEEANILRERIEKVKGERLLCEEKLSSVLGKYFKTENEDSAALISKLRHITEKVAEAKKSADAKSESLNKMAMLIDRDVLLEKAKDAHKPERSREEIDKQLKFVQNGIKLMREKIVSAEKEKAVLESSVAPPSVLFEKAESTYNKLTAAKKRFDALSIAIETLEEAGNEMKATLAPKISQYASELFEIATGGKYKALNATTELSLTTDNGEISKSAEYLSAGGRITAYICLRLALMKVLFKDTFPPMIFDDAFVRLDKDRKEQIIKAIMSSPAKDAQIFIFQAE